MTSSLTRRATLAGLATTALGGRFGSASAGAYYMNLGRIAGDAGLLYGAALGSPYYTDAAYAGLFDEAALLVSEWQFKIASLRPTQATYDFYNADRLVAVAKAMNKPLKAHCLFWQAANPDWMKSLSTAQLQKLFDEHIEKVVPRYAGKVHAWDVVNEPFWPADGQAGGFGKGPWYQAFGPDWPLRAFRRIASLDRKAKFALNESQCDNNVVGLGATIRPALLKLLDRLQDVGARVDAVGIESHLDMSLPYDDGIFGEFLDQLAERRVEIWLSELDVRDFSLPDNISQRDALIAGRVSAYLGNALQRSAVTQVVNWALSDRYSWLAQLWDQKYGNTVRQPRPLPFDSNFQRKPTWTAMANAFNARGKLANALQHAR